MYITSKKLNIVETKYGIYAYHSLFGNLMKLEPHVYDELKNSRIDLDKLSKHDIELLKKIHFIHRETDDEYQILDGAINKYKSTIISGSSITKLLLMVTDKCMLSCAYCYVPDAPIDINCPNSNKNIINKMKNDMNWGTAKLAIDSFYEIIKENNQKRVHIRFHGGEPLIRFDIIKKSIEYTNLLFKDIDVVYHMNTNGILIDENKAKFFSKQNIEIEISIDGPQKVHDSVRQYPNGNGSYNEAIKAVEILLGNGFPSEKINYAVTLSCYNLDSLPDIIDLAKKQGVKLIEINTLLFEHEMDVLNNIEDRVKKLVDARILGAKYGIKVSGKWFKLFERLYQPVVNYCGRIGQQIGVDSNGDIFLCTGLARSYGNISEWRELFKNKEYQEIAMRVIGNIFECRNCEIEGMCAGGCVASVIKSYHSLNSNEKKECEFRKSMVRTLIENCELLISENIDLDSVDKTYIPTLDV